LAGAVSEHSDTETGRCLRNHTACEGVLPGAFAQVYYYQDSKGVVFPMQLANNGQIAQVFMEVPKLAHFQAAFLHPLKQPDDLHRFHRMVTRNLRPLQPPAIAANVADSEGAVRMAQRDLAGSCVHNPELQLQVHHQKLNECPSPPSEVFFLFCKEAKVSFVVYSCLFLLDSQLPVQLPLRVFIAHVSAEGNTSLPISAWQDAGFSPVSVDAPDIHGAFSRIFKIVTEEALHVTLVTTDPVRPATRPRPFLFFFDKAHRYPA
jgi:hypothetical protein